MFEIKKIFAIKRQNNLILKAKEITHRKSFHSRKCLKNLLFKDDYDEILKKKKKEKVGSFLKKQLFYSKCYFQCSPLLFIFTYI